MARTLLGAHHWSARTFNPRAYALAYILPRVAAQLYVHNIRAQPAVPSDCLHFAALLKRAINLLTPQCKSTITTVHDLFFPSDLIGKTILHHVINS